MAQKVGLGIIGAGIRGELHARLFSEVKDAEVLAVADIDERRARDVATRYGIKTWYRDYDEMLKQTGIGAVVVATPDHLHREAAVSSAQAGKHILCEKPLATTLEDADAILEASGAAGVKLMVNFENRFSPTAAAVKKVVQSGEIGDPLMGYLRINDRLEVPTDMIGPWASRTSPARFLIVHFVDLARWYLESEAVSVYALAGQKLLVKKGIETEDFIQSIVQFGNGAVATFESCWVLPNTAPYLAEVMTEFIGTRGCIYTNPTPPYVVYYRQFYGKVEGVEAIERRLGEIGPRSWAAHFIECITQNRQPMVTGRDGRAATEIVSAMHQSIKEKRPVELPLSA